jgi:hypothetical protein
MPPALDMAAQSRGLQIHIIAPQRMGYRIPNISVMAVLNMNLLLSRSLISPKLLIHSSPFKVAARRVSQVQETADE